MPRRKALKVVVDIHLHAITCPGVFLQEQQDVFMYIELLGQRKRTQSIPPVFPFLFHEKLRFDKVFSHCTDPVQIASALSGETVRLELVQLSYPAGEHLATYEDNARDFLFPTPRACPAYPGVDREVLLQRASCFCGIAPKLEFSSRTIIKEVTSLNSGISSSRRKKEKHSSEKGQNVYQPCCSSYKPSATECCAPNAPNSRPASSKKKTKQKSSSSTRSGRVQVRAASLNRGSTHWGYEQPTVASLARSPSPYTRRRMAELSIHDRFDSAADVKLFKTELDDRPDFAIRKASSKYLPHSRASSPARRTRSSSPTNRSRSSPRRQPTSFSPRYDEPRTRSDRSAHKTTELFKDSDDESSDGDLAFIARKACNVDGCPSAFDRYCNLKSAYYRPITPDCCPPRNADLLSLNQKLHGDEKIRKRMELERYRKRTASLSETKGRNTASARRHEGDICKRFPCRVTFKSTDELSVGSLSNRCRNQSGSAPTSARSIAGSTSRPTTPCCDFSSSGLDFEPFSSRGQSLTPDSILFRKPLCERFSAGSSSPYEKIRDRVRDLLTSPRASQTIKDSERNDRWWKRRNRSSSPRH